MITLAWEQKKKHFMRRLNNTINTILTCSINENKQHLGATRVIFALFFLIAAATETDDQLVDVIRTIKKAGSISVGS